MDIHTASHARANLFKLLEKVNQDSEPCIITSRKGDGVLISKDDWESIQETLYLESIPGIKESIDNIDFQYFRDPHGWSQASLYVNGYRYQFYMTHILGDPLDAICMATVSLTKDANQASFSWIDEPGQYDWQFTRNKKDRYLLDVTISGYSDSNHKLGEELTFLVQRYFWIDLVILEVEKTAKLLTYPHYKNNRYSHTFPWQELKRLRQYNDYK